MGIGWIHALMPKEGIPNDLKEQLKFTLSKNLTNKINKYKKGGFFF